MSENKKTEYQFGDWTKSIFKKVVDQVKIEGKPLSEVNFKEATGRDSGSESYQFGDLTRTLLWGGGAKRGEGSSSTSSSESAPERVHESEMKTFFLNALQTSRLLATTIPDVRRLAIFESVYYSQSDDQVMQLLFECLTGSPYLREESKSQLAELALAGA